MVLAWAEREVAHCLEFTRLGTPDQLLLQFLFTAARFGVVVYTTDVAADSQSFMETVVKASGRI